MEEIKFQGTHAGSFVESSPVILIMDPAGEIVIGKAVRTGMVPSLANGKEVSIRRNGHSGKAPEGFYPVYRFTQDFTTVADNPLPLGSFYFDGRGFHPMTIRASFYRQKVCLSCGWNGAEGDCCPMCGREVETIGKMLNSIDRLYTVDMSAFLPSLLSLLREEFAVIPEPVPAPKKGKRRDVATQG